MTVQIRVTINILNFNCTMYTNSLIDILILFFFLNLCFCEQYTLARRKIWFNFHKKVKMILKMTF